MNRTWTMKELLLWGSSSLCEAGVEEAANDAWLLFAEAFQITRARYYMDMGQVCQMESVSKYQEMIAQRANRIPLQHIIGRAPFMSYEFSVNEQVLTPRADTEVLVEAAFAEISRRHLLRSLKKEADEPFKILDMCTGSGCIAISLCCMAKEAGIPCEVTAADLSEGALEVAKTNNEALCEGSVRLVHSNLFAALPDACEFDIIVSNPPYIKSAEIEELMPEVREHEPRMALDGMADGLYFYRKLAGEGRRYLKDQGMVFLEIGYDQGQSVPAIFEDAGYHDCRVRQDLAGLDRVVTAVK